MMIFLPSPLRPYAGGQGAFELDADTIADALGQLTQIHRDLRSRLFQEDGQFSAFVNLYLNGEDVRRLPGKEATAVKSTDTLSILPTTDEAPQPLATGHESAH